MFKRRSWDGESNVDPRVPVRVVHHSLIYVYVIYGRKFIRAIPGDYCINKQESCLKIPKAGVIEPFFLYMTRVVPAK